MESMQIQNPDMAWPIAALVLTPPGFEPSTRYPTIVSVHPFGSCKEQTSSAVYGAALAEAGFVVIAFDASYQGESGGQPRFVEDPSQRVEDISQVIDYAVTLPYVDEDRIGVIGVCGGGGYALNATLTEKRIRAVVGITPVNLGRLFRESFGGFDPVGTLDAMAAQRTAEAKGADRQVNALLPESLEQAEANGLTERDVYEATDYYKTQRGQQPGGVTKMLFSRAQKTLSWDAFAFAETLMTQPMMVVVGQNVGAFGAYRDGLEAYGLATASSDRRLVELPEISHYDLYDKDEPVRLALEQMLPFLNTHLAEK